MQKLKASITIGGTLPIEDVPDFCDCIVWDMCKLKFDAKCDFIPTTAEQLLGACVVIDGQKQLQLLSIDGISGSFTLTVQFILRHGLDYTLKSEGYFKHRPFIIESRGYANFYFTAPTDANYEYLIRSKDLAALQHVDATDLQTMLEDLIPEIPAIRPFHIVTPQHRPE